MYWLIIYRMHYHEYLVDRINKNRLDPIDLYSNEQIMLMLNREELDPPQTVVGKEYRQILIEVWLCIKL